MKKSFYSIFAIAMFLGSCTNKGSAPGGTGVDMMYVTGPVGGASVMSFADLVSPQAVTGVSVNSEVCSGCGTDLAVAHGMASIFAMQGKLADSNSCMIAAVIANDAVPGITSGEYKYIVVGEIQLRVKLKMAGSDVSEFSVETCSEGAQAQHISGTNADGAATFKFRSGGSGSLFLAMEATGEMSGGNWTSKTLTIGFAGASSHSYFELVQGADYMDITGVNDSGTLGTQDALDLRMVSRVQLLGDSVQNYALGDGSIRKAIGGGGATNNNWNGDTKAEGAGPMTYDSTVASATLPDVPTTQVTAFTTEEQWDCSMTDSVNLMAVAQQNSELLSAAMKCQEIFE